jgi:hypothetical protein
MLGMGLAKMYVDELMGRQVPDYFKRLSLEGDGLPEKASSKKSIYIDMFGYPVGNCHRGFLIILRAW